MLTPAPEQPAYRAWIASQRSEIVAASGIPDKAYTWICQVNNLMITDEQLKELFSTIDADNSGHVGVEEFVAYLEPSSKEVAALEEAGTARGSIFGRPGDK